MDWRKIEDYGWNLVKRTQSKKSWAGREELSALMGEKEDYKNDEDPSIEDDWED